MMVGFDCHVYPICTHRGPVLHQGGASCASPTTAGHGTSATACDARGVPGCRPTCAPFGGRSRWPASPFKVHLDASIRLGEKSIKLAGDLRDVAAVFSDHAAVPELDGPSGVPRCRRLIAIVGGCVTSTAPWTRLCRRPIQSSTLWWLRMSSTCSPRPLAAESLRRRARRSVHVSMRVNVMLPGALLPVEPIHDSTTGSFHVASGDDEVPDDGVREQQLLASLLGGRARHSDSPYPIDGAAVAVPVICGRAPGCSHPGILDCAHATVCGSKQSGEFTMRCHQVSIARRAASPRFTPSVVADR